MKCHECLKGRHKNCLRHNPPQSTCDCQVCAVAAEIKAQDRRAGKSTGMKRRTRKRRYRDRI